jgi:hypothetical protein
LDRFQPSHPEWFAPLQSIDRSFLTQADPVQHTVNPQSLGQLAVVRIAPFVDADQPAFAGFDLSSGSRETDTFSDHSASSDFHK